MALNFPDSPTLNQVYTDTTSGFSYQWDGVVWQSYTPASSNQIKIVDNISGSFNGLTQIFSLTVSGTPLFPAKAQQLRVVLGGIIQEPETDYTVSNSNIIFTTPPLLGLDCSIISLGSAVPINTIEDGTVLPEKLSTGAPSWNSNGDSTISGNLNVSGLSTFQGNVDLGDNDKISLGDNKNLQIIHNGTDSFIDEFGIGQLYIRSNNLYLKNAGSNEDYAAFLNNGSVQLYYDNSLKFETIGAGITITGTIFTDQLSVSGTVTATSFVGDGSGLTGAGSTVADDTTTNATFYPVITQTTSGTITASKVSTSKLTFNPSTGRLTATDIQASSDFSLKENIETVQNSIEIINTIRGVKFDWKENKTTSYGVIAQEIEKVLPELVNGEDLKSVNYNGLIAILIQAVKELSAEVEDLKKRI